MMMFLLAAFALSSLSWTPVSGKITQCCQHLAGAESLAGKVYYPNSTIYEERLNSIWSQTAALRPWCIVLPESAEDTSKTIQIVAENECPFGIRSGGHGIHPLSNSVEDGITIDFGHLNGMTYDEDTNTASLLPGGNWGQVYQALEPHGVAVAGGRGSVVGVAGFLLGGGNSFFNGRYGFGCDTVKNFEIVLADGEIVNANADENRDLWIALKGGSGNFGLVTRFDLEAIPLADPENPVVWGGAVVWAYNATDAVVDALVDFAHHVADDVDSTAFCGWGWTTTGGWLLVCALNNNVNVSFAPAFDGFLGIEDMEGDTLRSATLYNLTSEADGVPGLRNIWITWAFKADPRIIRFAIKKHDELVLQLNQIIPDDSDRSTHLQFQPITEPMVSRGQGLNSLGLEDEVAHGPGMLLLLQIGSDEYEARVQPLADELRRSIEAYVDSLDANWGWRYLNYAGGEMDPIARYGEDKVERLRAVAGQYDADGVFQRLRRSGFKIPIETPHDGTMK